MLRCMDTAAKKIFAGPKVRRLRRERGLSQSRMAEELGFSTSYLNLVERNQRPVSAQFLLRLAEVYDIDLSAFAGTDEARAFADLSDIFSDPLFKGLDIGRADMQEFADASPRAAEAFVHLYKAFDTSRQHALELSSRFADRDLGTEGRGDMVFPIDEVRDFIHSARNYFPDLDDAAELLHGQLNMQAEDAFMVLSTRLEEVQGVRVRVMPTDVMPETLRFFDRHRRQLMLSELMNRSGRNFQIAYQIGLSEQTALISRLVDDGGFRSEEGKRLARISLANYFAAAVLMPYGRFLEDARSLRYDIEHLARRYGTSFEQVCHRLTTLQRPGNKGVPFFIIRVDNAGNVSKRFSAGKYHFSRLGGTCPRWNVHDTFANPGRIATQLIQMPDDTVYLSVARTVRRVGRTYSGADQQLAIGLGCDLKHAGDLVYSEGLNIEAPTPTPVGPNCRLCERQNCAQRAHPPVTRKLVLDERSRGVSSYRFQVD